MKPADLCLALLVAVTPSTGSAKTNPDKYDLNTRVKEAASECVRYIVANAKDPDSIKLDENPTYALGKRLTRNHVFVYFEGMGRNTYGAVLRHQFECNALCKENVPCQVVEVRE